MLNTVNSVISNGEIINQGNGRYRIEYEKYRVVVSKNESGDFVLTAYDNSRPIKSKKRSSTNSTLLDQRVTEEMNGALVSSRANSLSSDKDTKTSEKSNSGHSALSKVKFDKDGNPDFREFDTFC